MVMNHYDSAFNRHPNPARGYAESVNWNLKGAQILKTSHMGSTLYGPIFWRGQMLGQVLTAAQARNTYSPIDLDLFMGFAHVAAAVYMAHGGAERLRTLV